MWRAELRGGRSIPVAVFFLPKHCTLWVDMMGDCDVSCVRRWAWVIALSSKEQRFVEGESVEVAKC